MADNTNAQEKVIELVIASSFTRVRIYEKTENGHEHVIDEKWFMGSSQVTNIQGRRWAEKAYGDKHMLRILNYENPKTERIH